VDHEKEEAFLTEIQLTEAMSGPHSSEWLEAICEEMKSILKNEIWVMVNRPKDHQVIDNIELLFSIILNLKLPHKL